MAEVKKDEKKKTTNKNVKKQTNNKSSKTTKNKNYKTTTNKKNTNNGKTTKTNGNKNTQAKKTSGNKSVVKKSSTNNKSKQVPKKVVNKPKQQAKQQAKQQPKQQPKPQQVKEITKEEQLEKTLIFDGRQNKNLLEVVEKLEEKNVVLEDKVIKRSNVKKIIIIILTILIFSIIAVTTWYVVKDEMQRTEDNQTLNSNIYKKVAKKYKTISDINKQEKKDNKDKETAADTIKEIEYSNIETIGLAEFERKILEKENMTILIASSTCYPCLKFEPTIDEVYKERNAKIYRINISLLSEEEVNRFRTYYAFKVTPTIFTIKEGIATAESTGNLSKEELINWLDKNA